MLSIPSTSTSTSLTMNVSSTLKIREVMPRKGTLALLFLYEDT